jgi:ankyrin repeat protein
VKAGAGPKAGPELQNSLYHAIRRFNPENVASMIEAGADPRGKSENTYSRTLEQEALGELGSCFRRRSRTPREEEELTKARAVMLVLLESVKGRGGRPRSQVLQEWLQYAGQSVGPEVVAWLYAQGAEGNVRAGYKYAHPGYMQSPLQYAVDNELADLARERLAKGDDVSGLKVCHTPLQFAARNADAAMMKLLLDHGAAAPPRSADDVGVPPGIDAIGDTPLLRAVDAYFPEGVRLLLEAGADPNRNVAGTPPPKGAKVSYRDPQTHKSQWVPLAKAVSLAVQEMGRSGSDKLDGCMEMVRLLLAAGADPVKTSSYGGDALSVACASGREGSEQLVGLLLDHCGETAIKAGGEKALLAVARAGKVELVKLLLDRGVDGGRGLLWHSTAPGNEDVVRLLVQRGADPDVKGDPYKRESAREKAEKTYETLLIEAMNGR